MRQQILTISLCCVFILSALSDVLSQPLHRTDLSNLRVNAFAQDSLGYIWIATANGLCKSFGESYDVFFYDEADEHSIPLQSHYRPLCRRRLQAVDIYREGYLFDGAGEVRVSPILAEYLDRYGKFFSRICAVCRENIYIRL